MIKKQCSTTFSLRICDSAVRNHGEYGKVHLVILTGVSAKAGK